MVVPKSEACFFWDISFPWFISSFEPVLSDFVLVTIWKLEIAAILGKASPLNPSVEILSKSSIVEILLVACLCIANWISLCGIPLPLSDTNILSKPPFWITTFILLDEASIELSKSSLIIEEGLSIISPAAILVDNSLFNICIGMFF